ncbi:MAG TPA: hypothetical protein VGG10_19580 [Rhizomicrobium sp.]|jgi:hypothetical protein
MRESALSFTRFSFDDAQNWHVEIFASNGSFTASSDFYCTATALLAFSDELLNFPSSRDASAEFRIGSAGTSEFIHLRAYVFDNTGHAAIETRIERRGSAPHTASANFHVRCEISAINRLGDMLRQWISAPDRPMMWHP